MISIWSVSSKVLVSVLGKVLQIFVRELSKLLSRYSPHYSCDGVLKISMEFSLNAFTEFAEFSDKKN